MCVQALITDPEADSPMVQVGLRGRGRGRGRGKGRASQKSGISTRSVYADMSG